MENDFQLQMRILTLFYMSWGVLCLFLRLCPQSGNIFWWRPKLKKSNFTFFHASPFVMKISECDDGRHSRADYNHKC